MDGWLNTHDLGCLDADGLLWVVDRRNDLILRGGQNVYPAEIEHVLRQSPAVGDAAVVPAPSDVWGQTPVAFVEPAPGATVDESDLIDLCVRNWPATSDRAASSSSTRSRATRPARSCGPRCGSGPSHRPLRRAHDHGHHRPAAASPPELVGEAIGQLAIPLGGRPCSNATTTPMTSSCSGSTAGQATPVGRRRPGWTGTTRPTRRTRWACRTSSCGSPVRRCGTGCRRPTTASCAGTRPAWMYSQFLHAEQFALLAVGKISQTVPELDAKLFAATQLMDEARHAEVFNRYLMNEDRCALRVVGSLASLFDRHARGPVGLRRAGRARRCVENMGLAAFGHATHRIAGPVRQVLAAYVCPDEARHVAFGRIVLRRYYPELSEAELPRTRGVRAGGLLVAARRLRRRGDLGALDYGAEECVDIARSSPAHARVPPPAVHADRAGAARHRAVQPAGAGRPGEDGRPRLRRAGRSPPTRCTTPTPRPTEWTERARGRRVSATSQRDRAARRGRAGSKPSNRATRATEPAREPSIGGRR